MEFNWEEFKASDKIAVHCKTEEEAIDFCKQMHEHGMKWRNGESYLEVQYWAAYKKEIWYSNNGQYATTKYYKNRGYTILEWSNYTNEEKENSMNLELNNLTEEQKKQIIELAKKFEQENEVDKLDHANDYGVLSTFRKVEVTHIYSKAFSEELFSLGLTAHTKEEAEKIRRRLLVEKELRDWAKKCKKAVDWTNSCQQKSTLDYCVDAGTVGTDNRLSYIPGGIIFTNGNILNQAIESIGQERLIRDYFGIDK